MSQPPISERQQFWLEHVQAAVHSDHSQAEYARTHGLKVKDLYQWKTLLTRRGFTFDEQPPSGFVSVRSSPAAALTLVLPNGVRLEATGALDEQQIKILLTQASQIPC